jgi:hypothetical protein
VVRFKPNPLADVVDGLRLESVAGKPCAAIVENGFEILIRGISKTATCQDDCQYREDPKGYRVFSAFMEQRRRNVTVYRKVEAPMTTKPLNTPNDWPNRTPVGGAAQTAPQAWVGQ